MLERNAAGWITIIKPPQDFVLLQIRISQISTIRKKNDKNLILGNFTSKLIKLSNASLAFNA